MTVPVVPISRDYLDKIVRLGKAMCKAVQLAAPILIKKYPDNTLIQDLIAAIGVVCALLPDVENQFLYDGGTNEDILEDPSSAGGINPSLPPAEDPGIT